MSEALKQARLAFDAGEVPVGAVLIAQGKIIARAHNQVETLHDPTAHAEMLVLTAATHQLGGKWLAECTLYVTLEPCAMCAGALHWARIGHIIYGASDEKFGYSRLSPSPLHPKTQVTAGIMAAPCAELLTAFFKARR